MSCDRWADHAACADRSDIYYPLVDFDATRAKKSHRRFTPMPETQRLIGEARAICAACPVTAQCDAEAVANDLLGMWAGKLRYERRQAAAERDGEVVVDLWHGPRQRTSLPRAKRGRQPEHGNERSWRRGCRCDKCLSWNQRRTDRQRARRQRLRQEHAELRQTPTPQPQLTIDDRRRQAAAEAAS